MLYKIGKVYRSIKNNTEVTYLGNRYWKIISSGRSWQEPHYFGMRRCFIGLEEVRKINGI